MKKFQNKIGILGGIGALASSSFLENFLRCYTDLLGARDDDDFPEILYLSSSLQKFSEKGVLDRKIVKKQLKTNLRVFVKHKTNVIIVVCISVMAIVKEIKLPRGVKIINLVDITNNYLEGQCFAGKNILVLSSNYTHRERLFKSDNCALHYVNDDEQGVIDDLIYSAMSGRKFLV